MCEMEVYGLPCDPALPPEVNIALKKPKAYMSGNGKATPANDGNINPVWGGQSCIQTNYAVSIFTKLKKVTFLYVTINFKVG